MPPKRAIRRQGGGARSGGGGATIQLRDGKQLSLPPWMSVHHLPEYGIQSSSASKIASSTASEPLEGATAAEGGCDGRGGKVYLQKICGRRGVHIVGTG